MDSCPKLTWQEAQNLMPTHKRLAEALKRATKLFKPNKFIAAQCIVMDSSHCGEVVFLPIGGKATFQEIPDGTFSVRGLASDISTAIGWLDPKDIP